MAWLASREGRALVICRDQLDPDVIRPGRANLHVELASIDADTATRLFARFFQDLLDLRDQFRAALGGGHYVPSAVQVRLLANSADTVTAAGAQGLLPRPVAVAAE